MHVMVVPYGEPKQGYLSFTLGNLWATQPIALLIWPPLYLFHMFGTSQAHASLEITWPIMPKHRFDSSLSDGFVAFSCSEGGSLC